MQHFQTAPPIHAVTISQNNGSDLSGREAEWPGER